MKDKQTLPLFEEYAQEDWQKEWQDMPEFNCEDLGAYKSILINFKNKHDMKLFSQLIGQTITFDTRSIWYPKAEIGTIADKAYIDES